MSWMSASKTVALMLCATGSSIAGEPDQLPHSESATPVFAPGSEAGDDLVADVLRRLDATERRLQDLQTQNDSLLRELSATQEAHGRASHLEISWQDKKAEPAAEKKPDAPKESKWYDKLSIRGYAQFRFNEEVSQDSGSAPANYVGDRSVSDNQSFLIRRARIILFGDVHEHVYIYFQPDFGVTTPGSTDNTHFAQIRDLYADLYLDDQKEFRLRIGQSKVPYGWENLQSSQNRLPLDRADSLNSAVRNERDLGVFFYYTPEWCQGMFKEIQDKGLKHSGNYGLFGFGAYNGQGGSLLESNDGLHLVTRLSVPYQFQNGQYIEGGVQAYQGEYAVSGSAIRPLGLGALTPTPANTIQTGNVEGLLDERVAGSFIWYPQPFGFQTEWTVGRGPGLNQAQTAVVERALYGGYAMVMYRYDTACNGTLFPFSRWSYFRGGYKSERNAPFSDINEWETGVEWQINKNFEITAAYLITDRTNTTASTALGVVPYQQYDGDVFRLQMQVNY